MAILQISAFQYTEWLDCNFQLSLIKLIAAVCTILVAIKSSFAISLLCWAIFSTVGLVSSNALTARFAYLIISSALISFNLETFKRHNPFLNNALWSPGKISKSLLYVLLASS